MKHIASAFPKILIDSLNRLRTLLMTTSTPEVHSTLFLPLELRPRDLSTTTTMVQLVTETMISWKDSADFPSSKSGTS